MKVVIIGAGFTGLSAAWYLHKAGVEEIKILESQSYPGGLAAGFKDKAWEWSLEHHYHHIFASDKQMLELLEETGLHNLATFTETKSATRYKGIHFRLDSPQSLLQVPVISLIDKLRTAVTLAFLKFLPVWQILDAYTAKYFLQTTMGKRVWEVLWQPLFIGKFGKYYTKVNAAWFWARIAARTKELGYFKGGFANLAEALVSRLKKSNITTEYSCQVEEIIKKGSRIRVTYFKNGKKRELITDKVLVTAPAPVFTKITKGLSNVYKEQVNSLEGLGAITLVLELSKPFFTDNTYWLNINEKDWPLLAVVEHTNFMNRTHYNNAHLVYVGKYLESNSAQYKLSKDKLLDLYTPYLEKISPNFRKNVTRYWLFKAPFAQPIARVGHKNRLPKITTPVEQVFWASMQHVYPWDRGTNFAVKLGKDAAKVLLEH